MRTMKHWAFAAIAASALALAGCGGGGSGSSQTSLSGAPGGGSGGGTSGSTETKTALSYAIDLNTAVAKLTTLAGDADTEGSALMMAAKYARMLGTEKSDGNSKTETDKAQAVLDARMALKDAIGAAKKAKTDAETAKKGLTEDDDPSVGTQLDDAIAAATKQITAAETVLGGDDLATYVGMVTGDDEDNPETASERGMKVAEAVAEALGPTVPEGGTSTANGAGFRVEHVALATDVNAPDGTRATTNPVAEANKYEAVSHAPESMTWAGIVGADDLMDRSINTGATAPADTRSVKVASIAGMKVTDVFGSSATLIEATGLPADTGVSGAETTTTGDGTTTNYMGIPGTVICGGTDCAQEDGELTGSWYFTPTEAKAIWMKREDDATTPDVDESKLYETDTMFATYGHWLVVDDGSGTPANADQVHIVTYAYGPAASGDWTEDASGTPGSEQAIYRGMAAGRSVHKVSNEDVSIIETHSGRFTATVVLTAKFGDGAAGTDGAPMLGGTVSGFRSDNPDAVDSDWTVTLEETDVVSAVVAAGTTTATGQDGTWSATSYGEATERPVGIYGGFNAHFTDGHVAGAYATRKADN